MAANFILNEYIKPNDDVSQETAVREAIEKQLEKITKKNGFFNDVDVLDYKKRNYDESDQLYPYLKLSSESFDVTGDAQAAITLKHTYSLECVVKTAEEDDYTLQLERLKHDVIKCLMSSDRRMKASSANSKSVDITGGKTYERDGGSNTATMIFTLFFTTTVKT